MNSNRLIETKGKFPKYLISPKFDENFGKEMCSFYDFPQLHEAKYWNTS
jgi:hypothetical protein